MTWDTDYWTNLKTGKEAPVVRRTSFQMVFAISF